MWGFGVLPCFGCSTSAWRRTEKGLLRVFNLHGEPDLTGGFIGLAVQAFCVLGQGFGQRISIWGVVFRHG